MHMYVDLYTLDVDERTFRLTRGHVAISIDIIALHCVGAIIIILPGPANLRGGAGSLNECTP